MRLGDLLRTSRAVVADRARAALTLLGIVIGAGSIVLLAGLLRSGEEALISANQGAVDADLIQVRKDEVPVHQSQKTRRDLSRVDSEILGESQVIGDVTTGSESRREAQALFEGRKKQVTMVSGAPTALALYRLEIAVGRFISAEDLAAHRRVCVVGSEVWTDLLRAPATLEGAHVTINGEVWSVVGVLKHKPLMGATTSTNIWDRKVLVPESTFDAIFSPSRDADQVYVRRSPAARIVVPMDTLRSLVDSALLRRHLGVRNFKIDEDRSKSQGALIFTIVKLLLFSTGLIALFVGGINIMNVMLVTVTERTREIGVRRAVGASRGDIVMQFLFESSVVAALGGLIGVASGLGLLWLSSLVLGSIFAAWTFHVELWSLILGFGLSVVTGIAFGVYPAIRAARLDPITALRAE